MPIDLNSNLPDVLTNVRTRRLFAIRLDVKPLAIVGPTPRAFRRIGVVTGGSFDGDRLSGDVMEGGSDWQTVRKDGSTTLDVRLVLRTNDDVQICMTYRRRSK
jgi:Protein of unknown function (DUF3237)